MLALNTALVSIVYKHFCRISPVSKHYIIRSHYILITNRERNGQNLFLGTTKRCVFEGLFKDSCFNMSTIQQNQNKALLVIKLLFTKHTFKTMLYINFVLSAMNFCETNLTKILI